MRGSKGHVSGFFRGKSITSGFLERRIIYSGYMPRVSSLQRLVAQILTSLRSWKWQNRSRVSCNISQGPKSLQLICSLRSAIIDKFRTVASRPSAKIGLAYFYCDYKDSARQSLSELFGCLSAQLAQQSLVFRHAVWQYMVRTFGYPVHKDFADSCRHRFKNRTSTPRRSTTRNSQKSSSRPVRNSSAYIWS
jgi:hypothetical protein